MKSTHVTLINGMCYIFYAAIKKKKMKSMTRNSLKVCFCLKWVIKGVFIIDLI